MTSYGVGSVAVITIICYLVGEAVKITALDNKYIPVIAGVCGGLLGIPGMLLGVPVTAALYRLVKDNLTAKEAAAIPVTTDETE